MVVRVGSLPSPSIRRWKGRDIGDNEIDRSCKTAKLFMHAPVATFSGVDVLVAVRARRSRPMQLRKLQPPPAYME